MLGVVLAALMAASFFMPWFEVLGTEAGPMMFFSENAPALANVSWQIIAFLASFVVAAMAAVTGLFQGKAGVLMLLAGLLPFALITEQVTSTRNQIEDLGLPMPEFNNLTETVNMVNEFTSFGAPIYFVSAALLVVIGLARFARGA